MPPKFDVYVVGDYCLDFIFTGMPRFPSLGTEVCATNFNMTPGGTCNSVIAMHRLGLKVSWAVDFGPDSFSKFILDFLKNEGVDDEAFIHTSKSMRKVTVSLSYPHERSFIAYYDPAQLIIAGMKKLPSADARLVYIPGIYFGLGLDIGKLLIRQKKMLLAMDGNTDSNVTLTNKRLQKAFKQLDILFLNYSEACRLTGMTEIDDAFKVLSPLCPLVVIKCGPDGAYACNNGQITHEKAIKVKVCDTTGAGDCFNAGFLKAWLSNSAIKECLRWGNIVGGLSTLGLGGVDHVTREVDVRKWLKKYD